MEKGLKVEQTLESLPVVTLRLSALWADSRLWWALLPIFDGSSSRLLPDFPHHSPYLEMEAAYAAEWQVVPASWESSITVR